jgi:hypothetical protein
MQIALAVIIGLVFMNATRNQRMRETAVPDGALPLASGKSELFLGKQSRATQAQHTWHACWHRSLHDSWCLVCN